jgi:hypothetical protein
MSKRILVLVFVLFTLIIASTAVQAQEGATIAYGDVVRGQITNRRFEVVYNFEGNARDVVIIEMKAVDVRGKLTNPALLLLNASGDTIADTSRNIVFLNTTLAIQLPRDGAYTVIATRAQGRTGKSEGEFTLELIKPDTLAPGSSVSDRISNRSRSNYYVVQHDGSDLDLTYGRQSGTYYPQISISRITERFGLLSVVSMYGRELRRGRISFPEQRGLYVIIVGRSILDIAATQEIRSAYELKLVEPADA